MRNDFAVFILSHGRPDRVETLGALERAGYTGRTYIVIDDEDPQGEEYRKRYGEKVLVFSKEAVAREIDEGDNFHDRRVVLYARNACFGFARDLGLRYFCELDDDYAWFGYRRDHLLRGGTWRAGDLGAVFERFIEFMERTPTLTVAFSQGGEYAGGDSTPIRMKRKAMNSFICAVSRPFLFSGRLNEDVNTYVGLGHKGGLFFTFLPFQLVQTNTQQGGGGMTDAYLQFGTYIKSFYSVMYSPSCVKIRDMGLRYRRIHHLIRWNAAVPKIIREEHRKGG